MQSGHVDDVDDDNNDDSDLEVLQATLHGSTLTPSTKLKKPNTKSPITFLELHTHIYIGTNNTAINI